MKFEFPLQNKIGLAILLAFAFALSFLPFFAAGYTAHSTFVRYGPVVGGLLTLLVFWLFAVPVGLFWYYFETVTDEASTRAIEKPRS